MRRHRGCPPPVTTHLLVAAHAECPTSALLASERFASTASIQRLAAGCSTRAPLACSQGRRDYRQAMEQFELLHRRIFVAKTHARTQRSWSLSSQRLRQPFSQRQNSTSDRYDGGAHRPAQGRVRGRADGHTPFVTSANSKRTVAVPIVTVLSPLSCQCLGLTSLYSALSLTTGKVIPRRSHSFGARRSA